jgi:hypothetical protein
MHIYFSHELFRRLNEKNEEFILQIFFIKFNLGLVSFVLLQDIKKMSFVPNLM